MSENKTETGLENFDGQVLIDLMYNPVGLSEFRAKYPYLSNGPYGPDYIEAIEKALAKTKEKRIRMRLEGSPRRWALRKQGTIGRLFNIAIDVVLWGALFFGGLVFFIGSHKSGGLLRAMGLGANNIRSGFAFIWFVVSYFGYTALAEAVLGSTIGGLICRVAVVDEHCRPLTLSQTFFRQMTKFLSPIVLLFGPEEDYEVVKR